MLYEKIRSSPFIIAGPCVIESEGLLDEIAVFLKKIEQEFSLTIIFKASFDKANRTSVSGYRGRGMEDGLKLLNDIKQKYSFPLLTDIHESWQAEPVAEVADILQIPAFLCRQTDLLIAAGNTGKIVNVKKAQFLSGKDMQFPVAKVASTGNEKIMLTERGTMFGYGNLIVDYRNIVDMKAFGYPVAMDSTHAVQQPGAAGGKTGGERKYVPYLAKAAKAVGVDGYFFEIHPEPDNALSDGPNMLDLNTFRELVKELSD